MKSVCTFLFCLSFTVLFAQKNTDKAVKQACECMTKLDMKMDKKQLDEKVSKCIETAALANLQGLMKEYDFDINDESSAEKVGEKIGMKLVAKCPAFLEYAQSLPDSDDSDKEEKYEFAEGKVTNATKSDYITISLEESSGDVRNFYVIDYFSGAEEIISNLNTLKNKKVKIGFIIRKIFDATSNEFKERKIVVAFEYWD
ncbi:MAG: hypothetical protein U0U67_13735 [Chitinophagales bacterium]